MDAPELSIERRANLAGSDARAAAIDCLVAGVEAAHPRRVVADALAVEDGELTVTPVAGDAATYDLGSYDNVLVLGGGNAAGHVAAALEPLLGEHLDGGAVVTDDPADTDQIEVLPGDHPVPSERGVESARRVLDLAERAGPDDLVLGCITGGGSALLPAPAGDLSLDHLRATTEALLASGAPIGEMNAVRKHLSASKGGQLARAASPATVVGLAISDVAGDDLGVIASGPFSPDPTSYDDALDVLGRYGVDAPEAVHSHLQAGADGERPETPTRGDAAFERTAVHVVASAHTALYAARDVASERGFAPMILSSRVRGEAQEAAKTHAAVAEEIAATGDPVEPPAIVLSGGETTVTLAEDHGEGGPNQEFVLSAALELDAPAVVAAVDTDGIDGATDAAGAIADEETVGSDGEISVSAAQAALNRNDAYPVLDDADALLRTGASGTNVNDLRAIVIERS
ncbi:glycerate 2-kinase [Natronoarchaeum philippinense]|uniref:Glycerate 2-kinase n=1 Tax=Natronoarchaeum philippinense TaxID=558529 RepID=A0A285NU37_NATPI|nr:DUF4147 domain-containing protein [Natronoarchaeum philippinense]SNZ12443.1 glycerate 2-kinase [Natronoarchaeum philippinense]